MKYLILLISINCFADYVGETDLDALRVYPKKSRCEAERNETCYLWTKEFISGAVKVEGGKFVKDQTKHDAAKAARDAAKSAENSRKQQIKDFVENYNHQSANPAQKDQALRILMLYLKGKRL